LTLNDGYVTGVFHHRPERTRVDRPPVLYLHGIQSHPGWFFGSADSLADAGHDVFQVTRRGSGANRADRGHARTARQILDDVRTSIDFVLECTGAQRLALLGVSWGGKLAAAFCTKSLDMPEIASLALVAPGIVSRVDVPLATKLKVAACLLARPKAMCDIPLGEPELFTDSNRMQEFLRTDPLSLHRATVRFMYASRRLDRILSGAKNGCLKMPVTLILSANDRIIDSDATASVVSRLTNGRAEILSLDGGHTLEFEDDPSQFRQTLCDACGR